MANDSTQRDPFTFVWRCTHSDRPTAVGPALQSRAECENEDERVHSPRSATFRQQNNFPSAPPVVPPLSYLTLFPSRYACLHLSKRVPVTCMLIEIGEIENIVAGPLGGSFEKKKKKTEAGSSRFVSLYLSLIPYYPAAALQRDRHRRWWGTAEA